MMAYSDINQHLSLSSGSIHKGNNYVTRLIDYTKTRRCRTGGFCFYRLEEPNGSDTYYAIAIFKILGVAFHDDRTIRYLIEQQDGDGSYRSIFSAYYALSGLYLMEEHPAYDPAAYLLGHFDHYRFDAECLPAEVTALFKRLVFFIRLCTGLGIDIPKKKKKEIIDFVLNFQRDDGGFGHGLSSLVETEQAASILQLLDYHPVKDLNIKEFIKSCETPVSGFTGVPKSSLTFIEYINSGIRASELVGYRPRYVDECFRFIVGCQTKTGGFSRGYGAGIATMENSYFAVDSLALLLKYMVNY
ncbi:MAG: hypothetical protein JXR85_09610 [Deltaproteobacteria bacterium]|nr:hypothetical protein [Deltaproteobacteria bacterium]